MTIEEIIKLVVQLGGFGAFAFIFWKALEKRTDQFIALQRESIESRQKVAETLSRLADKVEDIPCAAVRSNSGGGR